MRLFCICLSLLRNHCNIHASILHLFLSTQESLQYPCVYSASVCLYSGITAISMRLFCICLCLLRNHWNIIHASILHLFVSTQESLQYPCVYSASVCVYSGITGILSMRLFCICLSISPSLN
uniref:Uncharacterized protein n=1 Tax=Cacopsylla melanoneura TaxID=428564 RepID=A0A8D8QSN3_9HEMI